MLVSPLSGGQWQWTKVKHEWQLVGHIRTSTAVSQKLLEVSGTHGIFIKLLQAQKAPDPPVHWFPVEKRENVDNYFRLASASANKDRGQHLCFKVGGGADLGVARRSSDPSPARPIPAAVQGARVFRRMGFR